MITVKNITSEYPKLNQQSLPTALKKSEFNFIAENLDLYGEDEDIDKYINTFVKKLNELSVKAKVKAKPVAQSKKRKPAAAKQKRTKKAKLTKRELITTKEAWYVAIRRFSRYIGKPIKTTTLYNYTKHLQRDFQSNPSRDGTPHIEIIRRIQSEMVKQINSNIGSEKISINVAASFREEVLSVLKKYSIQRGINSKPLPTESLSGTSTRKDGIINSNDLVKMEFKTLNFTGNWRKLIGKPTLPFQIMFYGRGGSGKSTVVMQLSHYLADKFNKKVLFVAKEEGQSGTTKDKLLRLKANHANIDTAESIPSASILNRYDILILDSVNELNLQPDDIRKLLAKHPKLSTIQIFKVTKQGTFRGSSDFQHMVQAEFVIEDGEVHSEKNRFGGGETIKVDFGN